MSKRVTNRKSSKAHNKRVRRRNVRKMQSAQRGYAVMDIFLSRCFRI